MGMYPARIDAVLAPGEYPELEYIEVRRPPFIKYSLGEMVAEGYSMGIWAKYLETHGKTKVTYRMMKMGDATTSSFSFFTSAKLWSVDHAVRYLAEMANTDSGTITCKNLSNSMKKLYVMKATSSAAEILTENRALLKTNTRLVSEKTALAKELEDVYHDLEMALHKNSVRTLDDLIAGFDQTAVLKAYNDRLATSLPAPKQTTSHFETVEEAIASIENTAHESDSGFLDSLVEIFGEEVAQNFFELTE